MKVLFDTSAWVQHFGPAKFSLAPFLQAGRVMMHPFVVSEIALGSLSNRACILSDLSSLPELRKVADEDILALIEIRKLHTRGIGLVDTHLLASALAAPEIWLGTFDKRLAAVAVETGVGGFAGSLTP